MRIFLRQVTPQVWRRLNVPGHLTLEQFHAVLQIAFGWTNSHLYEFEVGGERYGPSDDDGEGQGPVFALSPAARTVDDLVRRGTNATYTYDFGDNWVHTIRVEQTIQRPEVSARPSCLGGGRASPPEDSGGPIELPRFRSRGCDVDLVNEALAFRDLTAFARGN